ncbi:hypothetical protein GCM10011418_43210 [Sphingobacterium alkalisoli]|nr:hypothetical protein GCM10011418_43210 [Sphingobacterium alkalisoli]
MIKAAVKDPSGLIWTISGGQLYRYDGVNVVPFAKLFSGKVPFDELESLAADKWGRIWLHSRNGLLVFDTQQWRFVDKESYAKGLVGLQVAGMFNQGDRFLIATADGMVWQIQSDRKTFLFYFDPDTDTKRKPVGRLFVADKQHVWLAFNNRLYSYDFHTHRRGLRAFPSGVFDYIEDLLPIKGGVLIRNYRHGYYIYDKQRFRLSSLRSEDGPSDDFTNWSHWSFTDSDRVKVFYKKGQYREYSRDTAFRLLYEGSHRLEEDVLYQRLNSWQRAGDEWFLSTDGGLYSVFPAKVDFDFMDTGSARGMVRQGDQYYFGGYGYLDRMDIRGKQDKFTEAPENNYYAFLPISSDTSYTILEGDFLGYLIKGKVKKAPLLVPSSYKQHFAPMAYCAAVYTADTLLVGTSNGIWKYARSTGVVSPLQDRKGGFFSQRMRIMSLRWHQGILSYTSEDGYFTWRKGRSQKVYPAAQTKLVVYDHLVLGDSTYLATKGRGLVVLDRNNNPARSIGKKEGLASDVVYQFIWQDTALFMGTHEGLSVRVGSHIYNYDHSDGLPFEEFNHQAIYYDKSTGRLFMGGTGGYVSFRPSLLLSTIDQYHFPDPLLLGIHIGKRSNQYAHTYARGELQDTINMPEDAVWFSMDFAHLAQYRQAYKMFYRILPLMDGYQAMPASGQINLTGMPTGEYHVSVVLQSGNQGASAERSWLLYKKPIFTETQGFYLLVLVFIAGLTSFVLYERTRKVKGEKRLRKQISRDLHDEVGGLLTGISMQADLLRLGRYIQQADSVASISNYSREAIQMMDDIIWAIDARNNQKGSLGDRMKHLAGQMLEPLGLDITFDMDHRYERSMPQSVRQNLYLIYKEALHNICKHGGNAKVYIKLHVLAKRIEMTIRNEGVEEVEPHILAGRPGQGVQNMKLRAEQIGGRFSSSPIDTGYQVEVTVPLHKGFLWLFFND